MDNWRNIVSEMKEEYDKVKLLKDKAIKEEEKDAPT